VDEPEQDFLLTVHLQKCCCFVSRNYNSCNWPYRNAQGATSGPYTAQLLQAMQEAEVGTHATHW